MEEIQVIFASDKFASGSRLSVSMVTTFVFPSEIVEGSQNIKIPQIRSQTKNISYCFSSRTPGYQQYHFSELKAYKIVN